MSVRKRLLTVLLLWLALIFVTSSFVIPFDTFVHFVQGLSGNSAFKEWFAHFWLVSWFVVVKGWHATEYAILTIIATRVFQVVLKWNRRKSIGYAVVFAVVFAASDEWHQTFVPGRDGCLRDVMIDSVGAFIAASLLWFREQRKGKWAGKP